jgi:oligopeptide transport system ATP-binding protein
VSTAMRLQPSNEPLLVAEGLTKRFAAPGGILRGRRGTLVAVDDVDLDVRRGEVLALVGESGSGKTTLGRLLLGLLKPTSGRIVFDGRDLASGGRSQFRRRVQPIFQNPWSSLDPRWTVERLVREPLDAYRIGDTASRRERVRALLAEVGLGESMLGARPHELSGGQRQRVAIASALALEPDIVVADEPVSALDVLVQAQILNLIARLQRDHGLAILFITHNLAVVEHIADRVAVMYLGRIVETGPVDVVLSDPRHPYTRALLEAAPVPDPSRQRRPAPLRGEIPSPLDPPPGCHFHPRCPLAVEVCPRVIPQMTTFGPEHVAACHVAAAEAASP